MENFNGNGTANHTDTGVVTDNHVWYLLPIAVVVPLALPANALILRLLLGKPGICSTSDIFVLNLSAIGVLFCFVFLAEYIRFLCLQTKETFIALCLIQTGGPIFLCFSSFDCYLGVCHPLVFLRLKGPKLRVSLCLLGNAFTAACCCLTTVIRGLLWRVASATLCVAVVIIAICSIHILRTLRQTGPSGKQVHPVKRRAFNTVLTSLVLINVHYLPSLFTHVAWYLSSHPSSLLMILSYVAYAVLSMSTFVQSLCYLARNKQLPKMRCHRSSAAEAKAEATG